MLTGRAPAGCWSAHSIFTRAAAEPMREAFTTSMHPTTALWLVLARMLATMAN